jgi:hypothetical protein
VDSCRTVQLVLTTRSSGFAVSVISQSAVARCTRSNSTFGLCHRCAQPPTANPSKYADELIDAYLFIEDADALGQLAWQGAVASCRCVRGRRNFPPGKETPESEETINVDALGVILIAVGTNAKCTGCRLTLLDDDGPSEIWHVFDMVLAALPSTVEIAAGLRGMDERT